MFLLILESLGSTELVFILVMALVFFGPRKLPQISRSLGKNLAEFRRASDDFKRTWNKEVSLEEFTGAGTNTSRFEMPENNSILNSETESGLTSNIETVSPDSVIARQSSGSPSLPYGEPDSASDQSDFGGVRNDETKSSPKSEWL